MGSIWVSEIVEILLKWEDLIQEVVQFGNKLNIPGAELYRILRLFKTGGASAHETLQNCLIEWITTSDKEGRKLDDLVHVLEEMRFKGIADNIKSKWEDKLSSIILIDGSDSPKTPFQFEVREPGPHFTGRKDELEMIHTAMESKEKGAVIHAAVSGLGGIGKSELALKYACDHKCNYGAIVWINAETLGALEQSFLRLARDSRVNISTQLPCGKDKATAEIVKEVYNSLSKMRALFIFDDAERYQSASQPDKDMEAGIENFLPISSQHLNIHFIVTSRNQMWKNCVKALIDLDVLSTEEAISYIKEMLELVDNAEEDAVICKLVDELQCFPLALRQAASYIKAEKDASTKFGEDYCISDYLKLLKENLTEALGSEFPEDDCHRYRKTCMVVWDISNKKILTYKDGAVAHELLQMLSFLSNNDIPCQLVGSQEKVRRAGLSLLDKYSLIRIREGSINIHKLVQSITVTKLTDTERKNWIGKVYACFRNHANSIFGTNSIDHTFKRRLLPHLVVFEGHMRRCAYEFKNISLLLFMQHECHQSRGFQKGRAEVCEKVLLARARDKGLELKNRQELIDCILNSDILLRGHNTMFTFPALDGLGSALGWLGDFEIQKVLHERLLKLEESTFGHNSEAVACTLINLSRAYGKLGDHGKVRELLERSSQIKIKSRVPNETRAASLHNLQNAYEGMPLKQMEMLEESLEIRECLFGKDHHLVAKTLTSLATVYGKLGDHEEKKKILHRSLKIKLAHYGPDHFEVALTTQNLGNAFLETGDYMKSKELLERALEIKKLHYKSDDIEIMEARRGLALVLGSLGEKEKQKEMLLQVLKAYQKHYGNNHYEVATTMLNLGIAYGELGEPERERDLLEFALKIQENHYGLDHYVVANTLCILGSTYNELGYTSRKMEVLERAFSIYGKPDDPNVFRLLNVSLCLASVYDELDDTVKGEQFQNRLLGILENIIND